MKSGYNYGNIQFTRLSVLDINTFAYSDILSPNTV